MKWPFGCNTASYVFVIATLVMLLTYQHIEYSFYRPGKKTNIGTQFGETIESLKKQINILTEQKHQLAKSTDLKRIGYPKMNIARTTSDTSLADSLYSKIRILCWVLTQPSNLEKRAIHIKRTWGRRCSKLLFFSSVGNDTFPTIGLGLKGEGRKYLTIKTLRPFRYVYKHYFKEFDWFLKTDDDAYIIMENLLYFLSSHDTNQPIYFGHKFKSILKSGWFSGGPGIVLSKEALRRFGKAGLKVCPEPVTAFGDVNLGRCMEKLNVTAGESLDSEGRSRFHCLNPNNHLMGNYPKWYFTYDAHGAKSGIDSMSDYAIAFHYVRPELMYLLEYTVYHLRPYGIHLADKDLNKKEAGTMFT